VKKRSEVYQGIRLFLMTFILKGSGIEIAMGIRNTDVSREAGDVAFCGTLTLSGPFVIAISLVIDPNSFSGSIHI
jgi:hypothetical protein